MALPSITAALVLSAGQINHALWPVDVLDKTIATVEIEVQHESGFFGKIGHQSNPTTGKDRGAEYIELGYKLRLF